MKRYLYLLATLLMVFATAQRISAAGKEKGGGREAKGGLGGGEPGP